MIRAPASRGNPVPPSAALADVSAGRRRALYDEARLAAIVAQHAQRIGSEAVGAHDNALGAVAQVRTDGQAALRSPAAQAAWAERAVPGMADAAERIHRHTAAQAIVDNAATAASRIAGAQATAAESWGDPARFVQTLGSLARLADGYADPGASEADRARVVRGVVGGAVGMALDRALNAQEPEFAAHILTTWGDTLPPAALQRAIARLGSAERDARLHRVLCEVAGGHGAAGEPDADSIGIEATPGAALHPLAGGEVTKIEGPVHAATISMRHPDGTTARYGGVGLVAVSPGDRATPAQVLGSARDRVTLAVNGADGQPLDPAAWLDRAGGAGALVGATATPRQWDGAEVLRRIGEMSDSYGLKVANIFHAGDGNLHPLIMFNSNDPASFKASEECGADILKLCVDVGGCLTGEHGVGVEKRDLMPYQFAAHELDQQRAIKSAFDPGWLLNPSKVFPLKTPAESAVLAQAA